MKRIALFLILFGYSSQFSHALSERNALIMFGLPASGKGTYATKIKSQYGCDHISSGDELRKYASSEYNSSMGKGNLIDDNTMKDIISKAIDNSKSKCIILDGYPRNISQITTLDEMLKSKNIKIKRAIFIDANEDIVVKRMEKRSKEEGRADDNIETFKNRLNNYKKHTIPVVEYYKKKNLLTTIDANSNDSPIDKNIQKKIAPLMK
jgi:adenylate kinase